MSDNANKNTPLHLAAQCAHRKRSAEVVKVICVKDDDEVNTPNAAGRTAIHLAAAIGNAEAVGELLRYGARRTARDEDNMTAVHMAAACEDEKAAVDVIRQLCADKNGKKSDAAADEKKQMTSSSQRKKDKQKNASVKKNERKDRVEDDSSDDEDEDELINWKSESGKTALHVAAGAGR